MIRRLPIVLALSGALVATDLCACTAFLGADDPIEIVESGSTEPDGSEASASDAADARVGDGSDAPSSSEMDGGPDWDVSAPDVTVDAGPPPPTDGGGAWPPPPGQSVLVEHGTGVTVWGIAGGFVIASDSTSTFAVPANTGGNPPPIVIVPSVPSSVIVSDATAFVWTGVQSSPGVGTLTAWHDGQSWTLSTASVPYFAAEYQRTAIVYSDQASGTNGRLVVAPYASPTGSPSGISSVYLGSPSDPSSPRFVSTSNGLFFDACADTSMTACSVVRVFTSTAWSTVPGATGLTSTWDVDPTGDFLFVGLAAGGGDVINVVDGGSTSFDQGGGVVTSAALFPSGSDAVYVSGSALKRYTLGAPGPVTLASSASHVWFLSPQQGYAIYSVAPLDTLGNGDVSQVPTNPGGTPATLSAPASHPVGFVPFPLGLAGVGAISGSPGSGNAWLAPWDESGGAKSAMQIASGSLLELIPVMSEAQLVYDQQVQLTGNVPPFGTGDLYYYSQTDMPVLVSPGANLLFAFDQASNILYYSADNRAPGSTGIYAFLP